MTTNDQELREALVKIFFKAAGGISNMAEVEVEAVMQLIEAHTQRARVEARLIELDLLEQAINRGEYGLTSDANRYKMFRLDDLKARLAELKSQLTSDKEEA